jgi:hypothetical protein
MTTKDRSIFLVEKYGEDSISVVDSVLENNEDAQEKKYWTEVKNLCTILIKEKKQTHA